MLTTRETARHEAITPLAASIEGTLNFDALQAQADARLREIEADTEAVREERRGLLGDIHGMADHLQEVASAAATRFSATAPAEEAASAPSIEDEGEPTGVLTPDEASERP